jgi:hypothetical protein
MKINEIVGDGILRVSEHIRSVNRGGHDDIQYYLYMEFIRGKQAVPDFSQKYPQSIMFHMYANGGIFHLKVIHQEKYIRPPTREEMYISMIEKSMIKRNGATAILRCGCGCRGSA